MNTSTLSVIIMIVSCIVGIIYHEYGHLKAAKKHNIAVKTFCIGFGKPVIKYKGRDGITYGIAPLPLGGYCSLEDDELNSSSTRSYISVLLAGVIRNLLIGIFLIVIGQLFIVGFVNPVVLFQNAISCFGQLFSTFTESFMDMFNIKKMASYGGFVSQMKSTGETFVAMSRGINHTIGLSLVMGGLINYMLAIFNALPVPGLDGGQVIIRLLCDFCKKVLNKEIRQNIVAAVNFFVVVALCAYQVVLLLLDVPAVQQFFLNL